MKVARRIVGWGALLMAVALLGSCPANSLLTDVQQKVNDYQASQNQAQITAFSFVGYQTYQGAINQNSGTITVNLPYGSSITTLVAVFQTTAMSVRVGSVLQVSGGTANDFTTPVVYTTVGQNGSTKNYTAIVTVSQITNYNTANGFGSNKVNGVAVSGSTIYAATDNGLSISINGGATWTTYTTANSGLGGNQVFSVIIDGSTIYAASGTCISVSTDGGASWTCYTPWKVLWQYVYGVSVWGSTIYAATSAGVSVSTDAGVTWTTYTTANGLGMPPVEAVYGSGSAITAATNGGLSVSADAGNTWTTSTTANGLGSNMVYCLSSSTSYANGLPQHASYASTSGGLSVSTDGGVSWTNWLSSTSVHGAGFTYRIDNFGWPHLTFIFAATSGGVSVLSPTGGLVKSYTMADGLGSNTVNGLFVSGSTVYAATSGGLSIIH